MYSTSAVYLDIDPISLSMLSGASIAPTIKAVAAFKRRSQVAGADDKMIPEANPRTEGGGAGLQSQLSLAVLTAEKALADAEQAAAHAAAARDWRP